MSMLYIGVDIGDTATKYGVFTVEGKLISKWEAPTALGQHGSGILPAVAGQLTSWVASHGYAMEQIAGVGVGIPGPVRNDGKVERCVNLEWHDVVPAQELSALLQGIPAAAVNDANMAGGILAGERQGIPQCCFYHAGNRGRQRHHTGWENDSWGQRPWRRGWTHCGGSYRAGATRVRGERTVTFR